MCPEPERQSANADAPDSDVPKDLKLQIAEQKLTILWSDGKTSVYPLAKLRTLCPCATCRGEREQASSNPLKILKSDPASLRVTTARLVGHYAIQFDWSDGHNAGMFDFRFLRALDSGC